MSKRGMLPKFRPAALGRDASARPSIRPVRPSPPPPPPSPPRKISSGIGLRSIDREDELEPATVSGGEARQADVATLSRTPETIPFEQESTNPRPTARESLVFDDETQARRVDDRLLDELRHEAANGSAPTTRNAPPPADLGVDYESLPSLEVRRPYDTYEGEFAERDPVTQLHAAARDHESASVRRANAHEEPSYPAPAPSYAYDEVWGRREESGPRERPSPPSRPAPASSYAAPIPAYDDAEASDHAWSSAPPQANDVDHEQLAQPAIPPAPRVPEEMHAQHPAFVVGVQAIRTATPDAWGTPHAAPPQQGQYHPAQMQGMQPMFVMPAMQMMPAAYAQQQMQMQMQAQAQQAQAQQAQMLMQMQAQHAAAPAAYVPPHEQYVHPTARAQQRMHAQPLAAQLAPAPDTSSSKVGRFAWFVAGAAFGITFAFFATGYFNADSRDQRNGAPKTEFPAAPALTAPAAPPVVAPPVAAAPVAPPVAAAPAAAPVAAAPAAVPPVAAPAAAPPAPPARQAAPPPARPRFQAPPPRRPSAPVSQAPKNLGGGGPGADDERPSAPASSPAGDLGDLLGAGLKP